MEPESRKGQDLEQSNSSLTREVFRHVRTPLSTLLKDKDFNIAYLQALRDTSNLAGVLDSANTNVSIATYLNAHLLEKEIGTKNLSKEEITYARALFAATSVKVRDHAERILAANSTEYSRKAQQDLCIANQLLSYAEYELSSGDKRQFISIDLISRTILEDSQLSSMMSSRLATALEISVDPITARKTFYDKALQFLDDTESLAVRGFSVQEKVAVLAERLRASNFRSNLIDRASLVRGYSDSKEPFLTSDGRHEITKAFSSLTSEQALNLEKVKGILEAARLKDIDAFQTAQGNMLARVSRLAAEFNVIKINPAYDEYDQVNRAAMGSIANFTSGSLVRNVIDAVKVWQPAANLKAENIKQELFNGIYRYVEQIKDTKVGLTLVSSITFSEYNKRSNDIDRELGLLTEYLTGKSGILLTQNQIIKDLKRLENTASAGESPRFLAALSKLLSRFRK